jgi:hypothetical protein
MEQDKFRALVEQVAILKDSPQELGPKIKPKRVVITETDEFGDEIEVEIFESRVNSTLPFAIKKLKPISNLCAIGCGKIVEDQVVHKKINLTPQPHWRTNCVRCQMYVGPEGELLKGSIAAYQAFSAWFNSKQDK